MREHETLKVITCSGRVEKAIADGVQQTEQGNYLSLDPEVSDSIIRSVAKEAEQLSIRQESAILLCSPAVRMYVKQLLERYFPDLPVLSYNELEANVEVQSIGVVDI